MEVFPCVSKLWWQSWTLLCKNTSGQRRGQNNFWSSIGRTLIWVRGQEFLCQVSCMIIYMREKSSERWDHGNLTSKGPVWTGRVTDLGTEEDKCSSLPWGSPRDWSLSPSPSVLPSPSSPGSCLCVTITLSLLLRTDFFFSKVLFIRNARKWKKSFAQLEIFESMRKKPNTA